MPSRSSDSCVTIVGAGPYGLSAAAHLRAAGIETRTFGDPMSFWERQMPEGMCLRSNWAASHISDPDGVLTLDQFVRENGNHCPKPIPLSRFVQYGSWFQQRAVPDLDRRLIRSIDRKGNRFELTTADGETFSSRRVAIAAGIGSFAQRPHQFRDFPSALASHSSEHSNLRKFTGRRVAVIGAGQSAMESAALLRESGAEVEVIARQKKLNWVGLHPRLHHLGLVSRLLYSKRDVGPAGISRLVAAPHLFRRFPRPLQGRVAYRAIRPAAAGWLAARVESVPIVFGRQVHSASVQGDQVHLKLDDGTEKLVDHILFATGYRVDVSRYSFLSERITKELVTVDGYPVLRSGLESSVPGLHFLGKPASWSFGPLLGFVSGTEFAATELLFSLRRDNGAGSRPWFH